MSMKNRSKKKKLRANVRNVMQAAVGGMYINWIINGTVVIYDNQEHSTHQNSMFIICWLFFLLLILQNFTGVLQYT